MTISSPVPCSKKFEPKMKKGVKELKMVFQKSEFRFQGQKNISHILKNKAQTPKINTQLLKDDSQTLKNDSLALRPPTRCSRACGR